MRMRYLMRCWYTWGWWYNLIRYRCKDETHRGTFEFLGCQKRPWIYLQTWLHIILALAMEQEKNELYKIMLESFFELSGQFRCTPNMNVTFLHTDSNTLYVRRDRTLLQWGSSCTIYRSSPTLAAAARLLVLSFLPTLLLRQNWTADLRVWPLLQNWEPL